MLLAVAQEIIENLDRAFSSSVVDGEKLERAEALFWLWTLGAYEIVRTMCQAKDSFSKAAFEEMSQLKKALSTIRMLAAKMEKPGKRVPVTSNRSPASWNIQKRDLFVGDPESKLVSAREVLTRFDLVFASLKTGDILSHHEASYSRSKFA